MGHPKSMEKISEGPVHEDPENPSSLIDSSARTSIARLFTRNTELLPQHVASCAALIKRETFVSMRQFCLALY